MKSFFLKYSGLADREASSFIAYTSLEYPWPRAHSERNHQCNGKCSNEEGQDEVAYIDISLILATLYCSCSIDLQDNEGKRGGGRQKTDPSAWFASFTQSKWIKNIQWETQLNALSGRDGKHLSKIKVIFIQKPKKISKAVTDRKHPLLYMDISPALCFLKHRAPEM